MTASEVERSKPAPDLYLRAAENLSVDPKTCVAVEDTRAGGGPRRRRGCTRCRWAASTALDPIPEADAVIVDYAEFDLGLLG